MTTDKNWFETDRKGLARLIERRGKSALILELISNACDADGTTTVDVKIEPEEGVPKAWVTVTDDAPDGFVDLRHAWTLFAESSRKGDAEKRGRFNLGEKLVLALCDERKRPDQRRATVPPPSSGGRRAPSSAVWRASPAPS